VLVFAGELLGGEIREVTSIMGKEA